MLYFTSTTFDSYSNHSPKKHQHQQHYSNNNYVRQLLINVTRITVVVLFILPVFVVSLYSLVASPPLHLIYDKPFPHAGVNSVYVPGSGFAGFWYHLGFFHSLFNNNIEYNTNTAFNNNTKGTKRLIVDSETNYYCYSSGCLSLLLASFDTFIISNRTSDNIAASVLDSAYNAALDSQKGWLSGTLNKYDIVDLFLQNTMIKPIQDGRIDVDRIVETLLPRIHVLITTATEGVQVRTATTIPELITLLKRTTWIPFVTGNGFGRYGSSESRNSTDWFLDGGFSRMIHPECHYTVSVPITWKTTIHGLNPGMGRDSVVELWNMGVTDSVNSLLKEEEEEKHWNTIFPLTRRNVIENNSTTLPPQSQEAPTRDRMTKTDNYVINESRSISTLVSKTFVGYDGPSTTTAIIGNT